MLMMQNKSIPFSLALEQRQNLAALAQTSVINAIPFVRKWHKSANTLLLTDEIEAPREPLIESYHDWVHAPVHHRKHHQVPPHMFSQWTVPLAMRVMIQNQFVLSSLVNLGCDIRINDTIYPGETLTLTGELVSVDENDVRIALSIKVVTSTIRHNHAIDATIHCMLPKQSLPEQTRSKSSSERNWETAGAWAVDGYDGLRFALLTGDFNPVHWADHAAKNSPFRQKVLHGFASLSLCWAALQTREPPEQSICRITGRFFRPVPLPSSSMYVYRSSPRGSGARRYELKNSQNHVYMIGDYSAKALVDRQCN